MSEYQYYEFQAVDRKLTEDERKELRELSTRAEITDTSFTNEYHWGDFRGSPNEMMERYFDAHLHHTNFGDRDLMLRFPVDALSLAQAELYCVGESVTVRRHGDHVIISATVEVPEGDWDDCASESLDDLIELREDILDGDFRALYLLWLLCAQHDLDDDDIEPPIPPGLNAPSPALNALAEFLCLDWDLYAAACEDSEPLIDDIPRRGLIRRIASLAPDDRDDLLLRIALGDPASADDLRGRLGLPALNAAGRSVFNLTVRASKIRVTR